ncbi:uncharacterized protein LOC116973120 isoform X2 [Amblyraja radiata]|uniref:uncharacterized protein LOC116973120 isoform X2 n=1 Tax=Amblyraja radiata TaxID=386614 RepID=UPI0014040E72|nr:uncharacterized protein LOC116973120 isoform X2 [Amblyraja radiata]
MNWSRATGSVLPPASPLLWRGEAGERGFQEHRVSPALPDDRVVYSGVAVVPGSFDHWGSPLVIFPRAQHSLLISDLKQDDVVELLKYFRASQTRIGPLSIVTDLRYASLDVVSIILNSLLQIQHQFGRAVDTFYAVQPQAKGIRKHILKALGLVHSKLSEPPFKCVLLNEIFELFNYIDRSQLTSDLGGYLTYQHKAWVHFRKEMDGFAHGYLALAQRFPGCLAGLQQWIFQSLPADAGDLEQFSQTINKLHAEWRRDLGIDDLLRRCEEIIEKFRDPKSDPCFNAMAGTAQFQQEADDLLKKDERLRAAANKVELLWQQALARARLLLKDLWCRESAQQISDLIISEGMGKIHTYKLEIANNLSQAEILKLDYDATIYNPAMKLITESEKLLQELDEVAECGGRTGDCREKLSRLKDMFHIAVELPRQTLKAVYDFYDIFENVAGWYHLLLQEISFKEAVCEHPVHSWGLPHEAGHYLKPSWKEHVSRLLHKAPLPAAEDLGRLGHLADCIPDSLHQRRGKMLSHQCFVVRRLLTAPEQVCPIDLEQVVQWQESYLKALQKVLVPRAVTSVDTGVTRGAAEAPKTADKHVMQEKFVNRRWHDPNHDFDVSSAQKHFDEADAIRRSRACFTSGHVDRKLQVATPTAYEAAGECGNQEGKALSTRPTSLSSFDSGIDGIGNYNFEAARSNHKKTNREQEVKRTSNSLLITEPAQLDEEDEVSEDEPKCLDIDEFGLADSPSMSSEVQSFSKSNPNALNFEIKVRRSASLPKNPWVSLPADDLEKSYVVTITPKKPALEPDGFKHMEGDTCDVARKSEERAVKGFSGTTFSPNKLTLVKTTSFEKAAEDEEKVLVAGQCVVHSNERSNRAESCREHLEGNAEVPCDSSEVCGSRMLLEGSDSERKHTELAEAKTYDWDMEEEEKLQNEVELLLLRTAKILEEEESVLRQEDELEHLLQLADGESSDENHSSPDKYKGTTSSGKVMSLSELSEAGVIGLEDGLWTAAEQPEFHCRCLCPRANCDVEHRQEERALMHSSSCPANPNAAPSVQAPRSALQGTSRLLQELEELNQIEDRILEENLKIQELCRSEEEQRVQIPISPVSNAGRSSTNKERARFLVELERERKEVEKMEQSLAREEKMKSKHLKKQPQISSRTKCDNPKRHATRSSAYEETTHLKPNPVMEGKSSFQSAGRNLKSIDKGKLNDTNPKSNRVLAYHKRSLVKLNIVHSTKKASRTVQSKNSCVQDQGLGLTMNNIVEKNSSCTVDEQIFIPSLRSETCTRSDKMEHQLNSGVSADARAENWQELDDHEWFALTDECKGLDSVDAETVCFHPVEGGVENNSAPLLGVDRKGTLAQSTQLNEIIKSNVNCTAERKNRRDSTLKSKEEPKPALRTSVPVKVEKLPARATPQKCPGDAIVAKHGNKDQQRVPVPKPRKTIKQCQTKSHPEGSSPFGKRAEVSAFVETRSASKEPKQQVPLIAGARYKSNASLQIRTKNKLQGTNKGTNPTNPSDSLVNIKIDLADCKEDNSVAGASSLLDSSENSKACSGGTDSKLVLNGDVCDEGKCDEQHILCNEVNREASAVCSSSLETGESCTPEILHWNEFNNTDTQKGSVRVAEDDSSHLHDFPHQDMHRIFEDCHARVSVTLNPAVDAHTFQASVIKQVCEYKTPIVFDTGSGLMKAGFADQELPTTIFPTLVGRPKYENVYIGRNQQDIYIGHSAQHMRGVLSLHYPLEHGIVTNWDEIEQIWHHTFYQQLHVDPKEHPILMTEAALNPHRNRERMVEIMFEAFDVPFSYVAMQAVLALYSSGRTTGIILDSGDGVTHTVPVYEGYSLPHAIQRLNLAGRDLTEHLKKLLKERGYSFNSTAEWEIVRDIKEKHCYVAGDYEAELGSPEHVRVLHYTLPDGHIITLGDEMFRAPEVLFKPEVIGRDHYGIHESLLRSIILCDVDLRKTFFTNIILSGGNTMLTGLPARIQKEISSMVPLDLSGHVHVTSPANRDFTVWNGGAALASSSALDCAWISQEEYHEFGSKIVHRKCF